MTALHNAFLINFKFDCNHFKKRDTVDSGKIIRKALGYKLLLFWRHLVQEKKRKNTFI